MIKQSITALTFMSLTFLIMQTGVAHAATTGDAKAGAKKVAMCAACHGATGHSAINIYPNLAGQHANYLESALKAYRSGERAGGMSAMMTPQAANLSDQDIADIAAYFSTQK